MLLERRPLPRGWARRYDCPMPPSAEQTGQLPNTAPLDAPAEARESDGPGPDIDIAPDVEAILLTQDRAVAPARVGEALGLSGSAGATKVREAVSRLNTQYESTGRAFRIESTASGLRVMTLPAHAEAVLAMGRARSAARLSRAAIETLAVIAYKQPITRAEVESIRGVACGEVLRTLLERRYVAITGRAEELGRPMLYGCTREFFEAFGLRGPKDLPDVGEFVAAATRESDAPEGEPESAS